ncbi:hypothetical protein ACP70R_009181 [Stipagrostis hirtigluma subsp. patula]
MMSYLLTYISKLLCIKIPSEASDDGGSSECCVCLSRIRAGEATRRLPCRHAFHRDCVDRWLASCTRTCPLCRVRVVDGNRRPAPPEKHAGEPLVDDMVIWFSTMLVPGF